MDQNQIAAMLRQSQAAIWAKVQQALNSRPRSPTEEIDAIPGRRIFYSLTGTQTFTTSQDGQRGQPINMLVSQDGPFIMTHYPFVLWKPSAPSNATDFGRWRPIFSYPLPDQVLDDDIIDISYEITDSGSQRNFQNAAVPPMLSQPQNMVPLPIPSLFTPNTTIQFIPTYENIIFSAVAVAATQGTLSVALPGYRVVNL